jgi:cell division protease FtsH
VAKKVPGADPVHKITIIPRGQALGVTVLLPTEDRLSMSKEYAEGMIAYAMGGRAAEHIIFGHTTTGAGNDIQKATEIARKMVCQWGMSEKVGPIALGNQDHEVFLGREWGHQQSYSQEVLADIDSEVKRFISEGNSRAVRILEENRSILEEMAESLLIRETLETKDIEALMQGQKIVSEDEKKEYQLRIQKEKEAAAKGKAGQPQSTLEDEAGTDRPDGESSSNVEPVPQGT